ncbi:MAG: hypothetical protein AAGJ34_08780 [Pseudomonadota bacterium]
MIRIVLTLVFGVFLAGCQSTYNAPPVSAEQAALIAMPTANIMAEVNAELPAFLEEDVVLEQVAFKIGRPLSADETELARRLGVQSPGKVRIAVVPRIPGKATRQDYLSRYANLRTTRALAAGYGIIVAKGLGEARWVLAHELVHVRQFERLGREGLARQVLIERAVLAGKTVIPIEQEAIFDSAEALGIAPPYYPY